MNRFDIATGREPEPVLMVVTPQEVIDRGLEDLGYPFGIRRWHSETNENLLHRIERQAQFVFSHWNEFIHDKHPGVVDFMTNHHKVPVTEYLCIQDDKLKSK